MSDGFIRKKVESLTLGEKLKKLRTQYRMSFAEVSKATRIQAKYLEYLENGEYEKLPAEVYVRGFLKSYARYLGLDDEAFLKLYDKERHIRANLGQEKEIAQSVRYPSMNTWILTPRTVIVTLLVLILGSTFLYLFSEFRAFVAEPRLVITEPSSGATVEEASLVLRGKTDRGASVVVNGEPVFVGSEGEFSETLTLQAGLNRITIEATNRFNKTKTETVAVESRIAVDPALSAPETPVGGFPFLLAATETAVDVTVASGETILYSGTILPGKEQTLQSLSEEIRISTDDMLHTLISINGGPQEPLGDRVESVSGKIYTVNGPK